MRRIIRQLLSIWREDRGQDLVEYTLLIAFMAMVTIAVFSQVGVTAQGPWSTANTTLATAGGTSTTPAPAPAPPPSGDHDGHDGH